MKTFTGQPDSMLIKNNYTNPLVKIDWSEKQLSSGDHEIKVQLKSSSSSARLEIVQDHLLVTEVLIENDLVKYIKDYLIKLPGGQIDVSSIVGIKNSDILKILLNIKS